MLNLSMTRNCFIACSSAAIIAATPAPTLAQIQTFQFNIEAQPLDGALRAFARTSRQQVLFDGRLVRGKRSSALIGRYTPDAGMSVLLTGTSLGFNRTNRGVIFVKPLQAQARPVAVTANDDSSLSDSSERGEIIVTAQKRTERLQDVPLAVNVATSDQLKAAGVTNTEQLGAVIPGLNISHSTLLAFVPSIRGIATVSNTSENPTAVYVDGVLIPDQREGFRDLADVAQITVLKGPQGTLFGRNATAGVIQISTKAPSFTTQGAASVSYGNYQEIRASSYLTGAVTDNIAVSVTAGYAHMGEGFGERLASGTPTNKLLHSVSMRGKLLYQPSSDTKVTLIADFSDRKDTGQAYQPLPGTTYSTRGLAEPVQSIPICELASRYDTCNGDQDYNIYRGGGVSGEISQQFDFAKFVSITSYRNGYGEFKFAALPVEAVSLAPSLFIMHTEDLTQELQLISPSGGRLQWTAGAYYFYSNTRVPHFATTVVYPSLAAPLPTNFTFVNSVGDQKVNAIAAFAQADYKLTDTTTLTLGGRYTHENHKLIGGQTTISFAGLGGFTVVLPGTAQNSISANVPTWRVALTQKLTPTIMAYASYNRGFKSGGFNVVSAGNDPYKPEKLDDFEIGLKTELFDRALTFNINGFLYKYSNQQYSYYPIGGIENARPVVGNAAKSTLYGIDIDFMARPTPELTFNGGIEFLHTRFDEFPGAVLSQLPTDGGGGLIQFDGSAKGYRIPFAQNFVGTLAATYTREIQGVNVSLNVTGSYQGGYYTDINFAYQKPYVMLNSSLAFSDPSEKLSLTFSVRNALNEIYLTKEIGASYQVEGAYAPPRQYMATLGFKF